MEISQLLFRINILDDCEKDGTLCSNGACLDSLCHCNDGYGGCNCQVPGMFFILFHLLLADIIIMSYRMLFSLETLEY